MSAEAAVRRHLHRTPEQWITIGSALPRSSAPLRAARDRLIQSGVIETRRDRLLGRTVTLCRLHPDAIDAALRAEVRGEQIGRLLERQRELDAQQTAAHSALRAGLAQLVRNVAREANAADIHDGAGHVTACAGRCATLEAEHARVAAQLAALRRDAAREATRRGRA